MFALLSSSSPLHSTPLSHSLFREGFTRWSEVYKRLGQFDYDQPSCTSDYIRPCMSNSDSGCKWIYIGEVKGGTDDTPHGIGIQVKWNDGMFGVTIQEGYWKNGSLHGRGREIRGNMRGFLEYYIGDYKKGRRDGQGTLYYENGDKYEGGWKDGDKHGQGTMYSTDEDMFTEDDDQEGLREINYKEWTTYTGQWDGWKGIGEINYKEWTKYIGEWGDCGGKHGLGTLYSADGKVLNKGRWEENEYMGKE